jgi:hypothetical protein
MKVAARDSKSATHNPCQVGERRLYVCDKRNRDLEFACQFEELHARFD